LPSGGRPGRGSGGRAWALLKGEFLHNNGRGTGS